MQQSVVQRFENDPRIVIAVVGSVETRSALETFWNNIYLRGQMIYDEEGSVADVQYAQPTLTFPDLPASRTFLIGTDGRVRRITSLYVPHSVVDSIESALAELPPLGDVTRDGVVDGADLTSLLAAWGECEVCDQDIDYDGVVGWSDLMYVLDNWTS